MDEKEKKIIPFLVEWAENFFKSKDAFHKNIISMNKNENSMMIEFKDGKGERVLAFADLNNLTESDIAENTSIITLNNRKNVEYLYDKWPKLITISSFKIYFINPLSTTEKKWIINPKVHAKICDNGSLRQGLLSMFETVDPLTKEIIEARL